MVELYSPLIYYWCRRSGFQTADSADIVQEVFRAVCRGLQDYHHDHKGDTFRGWLRVITRNKIRDQIRAVGNRPKSAGGTDAHQQMLDVSYDRPAAGQLDDGASANEEVEILYTRAMQLIQGEFSHKHWQAFVKTAINEERAVDVASELGMTPNAVRLAKSRILRRLRDEYLDAF